MLPQRLLQARLQLPEFRGSGPVRGQQGPPLLIDRPRFDMGRESGWQVRANHFKSSIGLAHELLQPRQSGVAVQGFMDRQRMGCALVHGRSVAMQIMITHGRLARTHVLQLGRWQLACLALALGACLLALSGSIYHFIFLKAARDGWPVVSPLVKLVVKDEFAQRDRFMRENLDAMAQRVGEMQARLIQLEAMGERVSGLAGIKPDDIKLDDIKLSGKPPGQGGPYVPMDKPSLQDLNQAIEWLDEFSAQRADVFTMIESRLFEEQMKSLMVPNSRPVSGHTSSGFGFRSDPFTGRSALHTGLDFPAQSGTPIKAAAGGVAVAAEYHPAYGYMVDLDHGNGLVTRYAHASKLLVQRGDLVKRGQAIAHVGSTGRSTGAHLHFEVLVGGVPQDPAKFLAGGKGRAAHRAVAGVSRTAVDLDAAASRTMGAAQAEAGAN